MPYEVLLKISTDLNTLVLIPNATSFEDEGDAITFVDKDEVDAIPVAWFNKANVLAITEVGQVQWQISN